MLAHWYGLLFLGSAPPVQAAPKKIGGDDVPRIEVWERRKSEKKDDALAQFIKAQYAQITGKTPEQIAKIISVNYEDDDEEILLLMVS